MLAEDRRGHTTGSDRAQLGRTILANLLGFSQDSFGHEATFGGCGGGTVGKTPILPVRKPMCKQARRFQLFLRHRVRSGRARLAKAAALPTGNCQNPMITKCLVRSRPAADGFLAADWRRKVLCPFCGMDGDCFLGMQLKERHSDRSSPPPQPPIGRFGGSDHETTANRPAPIRRSARLPTADSIGGLVGICPSLAVS